MFNFYGMTIHPIEDLYINETLHISWNTNIQKNFTLILTDGKEEYPIVEYINDLEYYIDLKNLGNLQEGEYYIVIKYYIENLENDNDILTSCVGGRHRRSGVGGRRNRRGCCLRLTGTFESNRFTIFNENNDLVEYGESVVEGSGFIFPDGNNTNSNKELFDTCFDNKYCIAFFSTMCVLILLVLGCLVCAVCCRH